MLRFPSNDDIINYFAQEYKDRINPPQKIAGQVLACSNYSGIHSLRKLIRVSFSTLVNSPGKALSHLALDEGLRTPEELYERLREILPQAASPGSRLKPLGIAGYLMSGVVELTQLNEEGKRKVKPTYIVEVKSEWHKSIFLPRFRKTLDGFIFEPFAHAALTCSNLNETGSSYLIWGKANSLGTITSQETSLIVLYWLLNQPHQEGDERKFIREAFAHDEEDVTFIENNRRLRHTINRLIKAKILDAEVIENIKIRNSKSEFRSLKLSPAGIKIIEIIDPLLDALGWYEGYKEEGRLTYEMLEQRVHPNLKKLLGYREDIVSLLKDEEGWEIFRLIAEKAHQKHLEDSQRKEEITPKLKLWNATGT